MCLLLTMRKSLLVSFLLIHYFLLSQNNKIAINPFENAQFRNYNLSNFLPSENCFKTVQSEDGSIWIASLHGISRFNGYHWNHFQQESKNVKAKIGSNWVMDIFAYKNKLWFHSDREANFIDIKSQVVKRLNNKEKGWGKIFYSGNKTYISNWKGIRVYEEKKAVIKIKHSENLSHICFINVGKKVIGFTEDKTGFYLIENNALVFKSLKKNGKIINNQITAICELNNRILVATTNNGVVSVDIKTGEYFTVLSKSKLYDVKISSIEKYFYNNTWYVLIGTKGNGFQVFDFKGNKVSESLPQAELPNETICSSYINHIFVDAQKGIWVSSDKGVSYFHPNFQNYKTYFFYRNNILNENSTLNAIQQLDKNKFLIGTEDKGLFLHDISTNKSLKIELLANFSTIIATEDFSESEYLVASTTLIGLFNKKTMQLKTFNQSFGKILCAKKLTKNWIGVGSNLGAFIYSISENKIVFQEKKEPTKNGAEVMCKDIFLDKNNQLWILRFFNGLEKLEFKTGKKVFLTSKKVINIGTDFHNISYNPFLQEIYVSSSAGIFIHSLMDDKKQKHLKTSNGLNGDFVVGCLFNPLDRKLYYSTPSGLYQYDGNKKCSYLLSLIKGYRQKSQNQLIINNDNELIFTVSNYFAKFRLNAIVSNFPEKPSLEKVETTGKVLLTNHHRLSASENSLRFQFVSKNFVQLGNFQLAYKIPKISNEWLEITDGKLDLIGLKANDYSVYFRNTDLSSGKVSALNVFQFSIASPFYSTWWFVGLIILLIAFTLFFFFRIKFKNQEKVLHTRMQLSRDLHDELGANVSSIQIMASMLSKNTEKEHPNQPFVQNIATFSKQINETINDIIWNVNPRFDTMNELWLRMKRYASQTFEAAGISVIFNENVSFEQILIDQTTKYHIYLLFKETVNNSAKYSNAKEVEIHFFADKKMFSYTINDNGIGFDFDKVKSNGNGLQNILKRAEEINGVLTIESSLGNGTKIQLVKHI